MGCYWCIYPLVSSNMACWKMDRLSVIFLWNPPLMVDFPASHVWLQRVEAFIEQLTNRGKGTQLLWWAETNHLGLRPSASMKSSRQIEQDETWLKPASTWSWKTILLYTYITFYNYICTYMMYMTCCILCVCTSICICMYLYVYVLYMHISDMDDRVFCLSTSAGRPPPWQGSSELVKLMTNQPQF